MWAGIITAAFTLRPVPLSAPQTRMRCTSPLCTMDSQNSFSRRGALTAGASFALSCASPAWAGYVTSLGIETTKPKDAEIDDELLASKEVQTGLSSIKAYRSAAAALKVQFDADSAMQLIPVIRKEFDFSKLRDSLNVRHPRVRASSAVASSVDEIVEPDSQSLLHMLQPAMIMMAPGSDNCVRRHNSADNGPSHPLVSTCHP